MNQRNERRARDAAEAARWLVTEVLGIEPTSLAATLDDLDAPNRDALLEALSERHRIRAALTGLSAGAPGGWLMTAPAETLDALRRRVEVVGCLALHDDARWLERDDWALRALGVSPERPLVDLVLRPAGRFVLRNLLTGAARRVGDMAPVPLAGHVLAAATGATFNQAELRAMLSSREPSRPAPEDTTEPRAPFPRAFDLELGSYAPEPLPA